MITILELLRELTKRQDIAELVSADISDLSGGGSADLSAIAEDVLPATDDTYDLGAAAKRFAEGWFSQFVALGDDAIKFTYIKRVVTNAELLALEDGGTLEVFPPPGANKAYVVHGGFAYSHIVDPYTNQDELNEMVIGYDDDGYDATSTLAPLGAASPSALLSSSRFTILSQFYASFTSGQAGAFIPLAGMLNKNLALYLDNSNNGFLTGGHADNTLTIVLQVSYLEVPA